jgi:hypothetical protein
LQLDPVQNCELVQAVPHAPQFCGSFVVSVQNEPLQHVSPEEHPLVPVHVEAHPPSGAQCPLEHIVGSHIGPASKSLGESIVATSPPASSVAGLCVEQPQMVKKATTESREATT